LFDAVSSLLGLRQISTFEGQAAMELEFAAEKGLPPLAPPWQGGDGGVAGTGEPYPIEVVEQDGALVVDWEPTILAILEDVAHCVSVSNIARRLHDALADAIVAVAERAGERRVALSGGCFQNRYLTERVVARLTGSGFVVYRHRLVPPNDGGLAVGQAMAARRRR